MSFIKDAQALFSAEISPPRQRRDATSVRGGYFCRNPVEVETPKGKIQAPCRKCKGCISGRKQAMVGRIVAEAITSSRTYFVTLTYRDGEEGAQRFVRRDWEKAINRLRMLARRENGSLIKHVYAFERGENNTRRCHIHAVLMIQGDYRLIPFCQPAEPEPGSAPVLTTPMLQSGPAHNPHFVPLPVESALRAWFDWWPRGHVNFAMLSDDRKGDGYGTLRIAQKVRYCAKYAFKGVGSDGEKPPFGWSKINLGTAFLKDLACEHAEKGLVPQNYFTIRGMTFTKGKHKDQHQKFFLRGSGARTYAKAFRLRFEELHPDKTAYARDWMLSADDGQVSAHVMRDHESPVVDFGAVHPALAMPPESLATRLRVRFPNRWHKREPVWVPRDCTAFRTVLIGDRFGGILRLDPAGVAWWAAEGCSPQFAGDMLEALPSTISRQTRLALFEWVRELRGADWQSPAVRRAKRFQALSALASNDLRSKLRDIVEAAPFVVVNGEFEDPLGVSEEVEVAERRRILAARLGPP